MILIKKLKYIIIIILLIIIKIYPSNYNILTKDINISKYNYLLSKNLYNEKIVSSSTIIYVNDIIYYKKYLKIIPINNEVIIPISGLIYKNNNGYYLDTLDKLYYLDNIKTYNFSYYNAYTTLCNSNYFLIDINLKDYYVKIQKA